jgi:hypothetical protein
MFSRRAFLGFVPALPLGLSAQAPASQASPPPSRFPAHDDESAREIVGVSHNNLARVKELVNARPALARASWDWGYGDWESPIDAASHVGNRPIAEFLIANGARPTIFTAVMLGQLAAVKALMEATPGLQRMRGPHGLTMMSHARAGGDGNVEMVKYLEALGDADPKYADVPLTEAEQAAIVGTYAFGPGPSDRLKVVKGTRWFSIERAGASPRNLVHQGALAFIPVGAEAVRISFALAPKKTVTVSDGPVVVVATAT